MPVKKDGKVKNNPGFSPGLFLKTNIIHYSHDTSLIVPQPRNIKADQEFSAFHFSAIHIGISKGAVIIIEIISLLAQQCIVAHKQLERVVACIKLKAD